MPFLHVVFAKLCYHLHCHRAMLIAIQLNMPFKMINQLIKVSLREILLEIPEYLGKHRWYKVFAAKSKRSSYFVRLAMLYCPEGKIKKCFYPFMKIALLYRNKDVLR